jgi:hypothetical protein
VTGTVRLILDQSALLLFARGALPVGETLAEVVDEGDLYATPVTVLVDVLRMLDSDDEPEIAEMRRLVRLLMASESAVVLPVEGGSVDALLYWTPLVATLSNATCVVAMLSTPGSYLLTGQPEYYVDELGDGPIITIED